MISSSPPQHPLGSSYTRYLQLYQECHRSSDLWPQQPKMLLGKIKSHRYGNSRLTYMHSPGPGQGFTNSVGTVMLPYPWVNKSNWATFCSEFKKEIKNLSVESVLQTKCILKSPAFDHNNHFHTCNFRSTTLIFFSSRMMMLTVFRVHNLTNKVKRQFSTYCYTWSRSYYLWMGRVYSLFNIINKHKWTFMFIIKCIVVWADLHPLISHILQLGYFFIGVVHFIGLYSWKFGLPGFHITRHKYQTHTAVCTSCWLTLLKISCNQ